MEARGGPVGRAGGRGGLGGSARVAAFGEAGGEGSDDGTSVGIPSSICYGSVASILVQIIAEELMDGIP